MIRCHSDAHGTKHKKEHKRRRRVVTTAVRGAENDLISQIANKLQENSKTKAKQKSKPKKLLTKLHAELVGSLDQLSIPLPESASNKRSAAKAKPKLLRQRSGSAEILSPKSEGTGQSGIHINVSRALSPSTSKLQKVNLKPESSGDARHEELMEELRLLNHQIGYLCLKKLQSASSSCNFVKSIDGTRQNVADQQIVPSTSSSIAPHGGESKINVFAENEQLAAGGLAMGPGPEIFDDHRHSIPRVRATWTEVAAVLNRVWGFLYVMASFVVFVLYLMPLLGIIGHTFDANSSTYHVNRQGC